MLSLKNKLRAAVAAVATDGPLALPETRITREALRPHAYAAALEVAFDVAMAGAGKLPDSVLGLEGMSGRKYRRLINEAVARIPDPSYLEVGCWKGSTLCAALYGNTVRARAIDNWALFGGPKAEFERNVQAVRSPAIDFAFLEADFRAVDYAALGQHNIYLFDGPHEVADQCDGLVLAQPALARDCLIIVDDWNMPKVREGTRLGLEEAGLEVCHSLTVFTSDAAHGFHQPPVNSAHSDWHNGYFVACTTRR